MPTRSMTHRYDEPNKEGKITVIVGGQYGSEAKGEIVGHICKEGEVDVCVRTGAVNAGHTVYYKDKPYKMQQIPCGWVNPDVQLIIGRGAYVSPEILEREIAMIKKATGHKPRLQIDHLAGLHLPEHHKAEGGLHERMGSTGEGVMEASIAKMKRTFDYKYVRDMETHYSGVKGLSTFLADTVEVLNDAYDEGQHVLLEGTQGTMLDLHFGHHPFVTSRQTIAANWLAEAGLSPSLNVEIGMVIRAMPIRVAGNSGPLMNEISWDKLAMRVNERLQNHGRGALVKVSSLDAYIDALSKAARELDITMFPNKEGAEYQKEHSAAISNLHKRTFEIMQEGGQSEEFKDLLNLFEMTTVTKKLRRIAELHVGELKYAVRLNRPQWIALTFINYLFPTTMSVKSWEDLSNSPEGEQALKFVSDIEANTGADVRYVTTNRNQVIRMAGR